MSRISDNSERLAQELKDAAGASDLRAQLDVASKRIAELTAELENERTWRDSRDATAYALMSTRTPSIPTPEALAEAIVRAARFGGQTAVAAARRMNEVANGRLLPGGPSECELTSWLRYAMKGAGDT